LKGCDEKVHSAHYVCCILWLLKEGGWVVSLNVKPGFT
jgi:hypothetical protein